MNAISRQAYAPAKLASGVKQEWDFNSTPGEMKLAGVNQKVLAVLEISRLNTLFEIYPADSAALQSFGKPA